MRFTAVLPVLALAGVALAVPAPEPTVFVERALPSGHPVIDNSFLSKYGDATSYTIKTDIYPSGFSIPTEPITALPSGYSVAWNGVYDPEGSTVSFFPSSVLAQVIASTSTPSAVSVTSNPGAPGATSTSPAASGSSGSASASTTAAASNGADLTKPSLALAMVALVMTFMA